MGTRPRSSQTPSPAPLSLQPSSFPSLAHVLVSWWPHFAGTVECDNSLWMGRMDVVCAALSAGYTMLVTRSSGSTGGQASKVWVVLGCRGVPGVCRGRCRRR